MYYWFLALVIQKVAELALECDVLVVGAGPAGCSAAIAASWNGAKVIVVEKKNQVGIPVSCAGVIGTFLMPLMPFTIPMELLLWKNNEVIFSFEGVKIRRRGGIWSSYTIDRSRFDSWLAAKAMKSGAQVHLNAELMELEVDKDFNPQRAVVKTKTGGEVIEPRIVIAADGADSIVSKKIGVQKSFIMGNGLVYEFQDVELAKADANQIFFGSFIPGGYAYIFPTSKNSANIGVGSILKGTSLERSFQEFCELPAVKKQIRNKKIKAERSGLVPFSRPVDKMQYGNVLFAGDAGGQNMKPLVEGILPAVICGGVAGESAARYVTGSDVDLRYEENLRKKSGYLFDANEKYTSVLEELSKSKEEKSYLAMVGLCSHVFSLDDFPRLKNEGYDRIRRRIEDWNGSRARQLKTNLEEKILASYLRLSSYI